MKWTKAYRKTHGKELMYDTTLDFEKKKEEPVKYNRDLYVKTVQAMGRIQEIKQAREKRFKNARIKDAKKRNVAAIDRLLVDKADYIKNKEVRDKYKTRASEKLKAEVAAIESKKTKLQQELLAASDDQDEDEDNYSESGMEEEDMDDIA